MELTTEDWVKIRLISDQTLYPEAVDFIATHGTVDGLKQINGLLEVANSWDNLLQFVAHQRERSWSGGKEHYRTFYQELEKYLKGLQQRVATLKLLPPDVDLKARKPHVQALAQAFLQHLAAENLWQERVR